LIPPLDAAPPKGNDNSNGVGQDARIT